MPTLHETLAKSHPKLQRGRVWCRTCGRTQRLDSANALRTGWPKCCGYTMTIDAPDERTPAPSNAKVSGAGTASAGLPGYAGDNQERKDHGMV